MAFFEELLRDDFMQNKLQEREQREKQQEAFALTLRESDYIYKANNVQVSILRDYVYLSSEDLQEAEIRAEIRDKVLEALKRKRISASKIVKISERVLSGKYWSYYMTHIGGEPAQGKQRRLVYSIESNIDGLRQEFDTGSLPDFFSTDNIRERGRLLGVPDDGKYIPIYELSTVRGLHAICKGQELLHGDDGRYIRTVLSPYTNMLSQIGSEALTNKTIDDNSFEKKYIIPAGKDVNCYMTKEAYDKLEKQLKKPNADKLLMQAIGKAASQGFTNREIILPLEETMEARGLKDRKTAAEQVSNGLDLLAAVQIDLKRPNTTRQSIIHFPLADYTEFFASKGRKSFAIIRFSEQYFNIVKTDPAFVLYDKRTLAIPDTMPTVYRILKAFQDHKRRNIGKADNIENKLAVSTLLKKTNLPTYESLNDKWRAPQLIIKPFLKALEYIEEHGIFTFQLQHHQKGNTSVFLSDNELERVENDYNLFQSIVIEVIWFEEPDYTHLLERKKVQQEKTAHGKAKRGKPVKKSD